MSTSFAKIESNRRNAQLSTGPRTAEGRARVSLNAVRHGLRSNTVIVRGEDADFYQAMRQQLEIEHRPATALEVVLVDQLAQLVWKLRRLADAEAELCSISSSSGPCRRCCRARPDRRCSKISSRVTRSR